MLPWERLFLSLWLPIVICAVLSFAFKSVRKSSYVGFFLSYFSTVSPKYTNWGNGEMNVNFFLLQFTLNVIFKLNWSPAPNHLLILPLQILFPLLAFSYLFQFISADIRKTISFLLLGTKHVFGLVLTLSCNITQLSAY